MRLNAPYVLQPIKATMKAQIPSACYVDLLSFLAISG